MALTNIPRTYDPLNVDLIIGGHAPSDYAAGTKINVSKAENNVLPVVGVDGEVALAVNRNNTGMLTFSLKNTSPSNKVLASYLATVNLGSGISIFPVLMRDPSSGMQIETIGWYEVQPDLSFSQEIDQLDYVIGLVDSTYKVFEGQSIAESIISSVIS